MTQRYAFGHEWTNYRGQVFVCLRDPEAPENDHPLARADGMYPRAKFVMEEELAKGTETLAILFNSDMANPIPPASGPWFHQDAKIGKRYLKPEERVYHMDGNPGNDDPTNLILFPSAKALAQFRSAQYKLATGRKDWDYRDRLRGLTESQRERRETMGTERAQAAERRSTAARKAHADRKARERANKQSGALDKDATPGA